MGWRAFLRGLGSIFDICPAPRPARLNLPRPRSDADAIADDWRKVLGDFERVAGRLPAVAETPAPRDDRGMALPSLTPSRPRHLCESCVHRIGPPILCRVNAPAVAISARGELVSSCGRYEGKDGMRTVHEGARGRDG